MTPEQRTRLVKLMRMQPWGVNFTSPDQDCIRAALAEIDRLRKHNLDLQRSYDEACSDAAGYESEAVRLRAENDRLTAEVARLSDPERVLAEARMKFIEGGIEMKHWAVQLIAMSFKEFIGGAPNFASVEVFPEEGSPLLVTVERLWGKTRAKRIAELEAERDKWKHLYESQHMPRLEGFKPTEAP